MIRRFRKCFYFLPILLSVGLTASGQHDVTTGGEVSAAASTALEAITPGSAAGGNVLWDTHHGIHPGYSPSDRYSNLAAILNSTGYTVDENSSGVLNVDLSNYAVVVVCVGSAWNSAYSPAEVDALVTHVNNGGGLLIMGDNANCHNGNINPVSQAFGTTVGVNLMNPLALTVTNLAAEPVFAGVSSIFMQGAGEISGSAPSSEIAWAPTGEAVVAVAEVGGGRIVITGDINSMDNTYISRAQNQLFSENTFAWLSEGAPAECVLDIALSYGGGMMSIDVDLGTGVPATWNAWLAVMTYAIPLWSVPIPAIDPPVSLPLSFPFPALGNVGILTTLVTAEKGITCSDWETVNTGGER